MPHTIHMHRGTIGSLVIPRRHRIKRCPLVSQHLSPYTRLSRHEDLLECFQRQDTHHLSGKTFSLIQTVGPDLPSKLAFPPFFQNNLTEYLPQHIPQPQHLLAAQWTVPWAPHPAALTLISTGPSLFSKYSSYFLRNPQYGHTDLKAGNKVLEHQSSYLLPS